MDKYIYDESNGLWYELQGNYYIPCLILPAEKEHKSISLWGQQQRTKSVVEQYNRDLAEWEYQVSKKSIAATKEQHRPPEKQSVLKHLREIQERNKQKPPQRQRKKSFDRDSR